MNYKHQENGALPGPLIFTVPAYDFVMALYFDWLGQVATNAGARAQGDLTPTFWRSPLWRGAEIQVRTLLQHAWAEIEHDIQYKSPTAIPKEIRRRFMALAGDVGSCRIPRSHLNAEVPGQNHICVCELHLLLNPSLGYKEGSP
jgi:hypothetical protein